MSTTQTVSRDQLRSIIDDEMQQWDALVAEVGLSSLNTPGFMGDWTFLDVAAHLTAWRQQTINRLNAAAHGLPEPSSDIDDSTDSKADASNEKIYEREHSRRAVDVLHEAHESYEHLKRAIEALSLDDLADPDRFSWLGGRSLNNCIVDRSLFDHFHIEHEPEIRRKLAEIG
jgi:hypothetical protein